MENQRKQVSDQGIWATGTEVNLEISGLDDVVQRQKANYYFRGGKHYLLYDEIIDDKGTTTKSRLKFCEGYLELKRQGNVNMELVLEAGKEYDLEYPSAMGTLTITMATDYVRVQKEEGKLLAQALYSMGQEGWKNENCKINIKISA